MSNKPKHILLMTGLLCVFSGELISPVSAQTIAPSLADGVMCAARGKTAAGARIYAYTSVIDNASMKKKQPVSVTLVSPVSDVYEGQILVIDKKNKRILVDDFEAATSPEMKPVGKAVTVHQKNNSFAGKTEAGTPVSFTLENNLRTFKLVHGNETYTGVCH